MFNFSEKSDIEDFDENA